MRELFLHIGHPKTGTSYLQASFANSDAAFAEHGIEYPGGGSQESMDWKISSGNGRMLVQDPVESFDFKADKVFFSSENLFMQLGGKGAEELLPRLSRICANNGIAKVHMLLFLRDPISHAESGWQQKIKRGGGTDDAPRSFATYKTPEMVLKVLDAQIEGVEIEWHVFSYDKHKRDLLPIVERVLGIAEGSLERGTTRTVNRSLTASELELVRSLNGVQKDLGRVMSDAFCNELPEMKTQQLFPSTDVQKAMLDRLAPAIHEINGRIAPEEAYEPKLREPVEIGESLPLTREQLDVIGRTLGGRIALTRLRRQQDRVRRQIVMAQVYADCERPEKAAEHIAEAEKLLGELPEHDDNDGLNRQIKRVRRML